VQLNTKHYGSQNHIKNLIGDDFYKNLVVFRDVVASSCDEYFYKLGAPKVDLFLIGKNVSSPIGKGSDSEPIPFMLGEQHVFLVDSSQFGMEPLVMKNFDIVYCYSPSFRGENSDDRHLNQFYHCEAEISGGLDECMKIAEGLIKAVIKNVIKNHKAKRFIFEKNNFEVAENILANDFPRLTFNEVEKLLAEHDRQNLIVKNEFGRTITKEGEIKLAKLLGNKSPVWITHYDRNIVAFYQKPGGYPFLKQFVYVC
jgi:asparaginyl-tRNA synthetase